MAAVMRQVLQPLVAPQRGRGPEALTWPTLLSAAAAALADSAQHAPAACFTHRSYREALAEAAAEAVGLAARVGAPATHTALDGLGPRASSEVAAALASALSAAQALLQRSAAADVGAERVAFAAAALQVLHGRLKSPCIFYPLYTGLPLLCSSDSNSPRLIDTLIRSAFAQIGRRINLAKSLNLKPSYRCCPLGCSLKLVCIDTLTSIHI